VTFALISPRDRFDPRWTAILPILAAVVGVYSMFWGEELALPGPFTILLLVISTVVLYRYRRLFNETERRQTKWVVMGLLVFFAGVPLWTYTFIVAAPDTAGDMLLITLGGWTLVMLMTLFLPIATFIAIFRHQLWDINLILNRMLVYGGLSFGIVAVYALVVGGLGTMLHTRSNFTLSLFATGLIATLFQPVRERLQRAVNRMMFGERDDPYSVLSQLGHRLQETAAPDQTLSAITATITQTLKLPYAAIEVETAEGEHRPVAISGRWQFATIEWPLRYQGQVIGRLVAGTRSPGENFNSQERQLLADIASQAGAAAYAVRLTTALQHSRERLVLAREEERRRIRRDLHDELGPSLASQTFQFDTVLELLASDPTAAAELLTTLKQRNQSLVSDVRRLVYELRPPALDELGLLGALRAHFDQITSPVITLTAAPDPLPILPAAIEVAAYRIALEAVNNVIRHAQANHCAVMLTIKSNVLSLTIEDDGAGMPSGKTAGIGLRSMRERAEEVGGTFGVETPSGGVRVTAILPIGAS
jgi:signal transduction histidine kinase